MLKLLLKIIIIIIIDPREYPLLLAEGPFNSVKQKQELVEIIFENLNSPAMYMSSDAMLASLCVGILLLHA